MIVATTKVISMSCDNIPTLKQLQDVATNADVLNEAVTSDQDLTPTIATDGEQKKTLSQFEREFNEAIQAAGGVPLDDGVYDIGKTYTKYNQYLVFNGVPYKPASSTPLPYETVETTPFGTGDDGRVVPFADVQAGDLVTVREDLLGPGTQLYMGSDGETVKVGDVVPVGTTHLRVNDKIVIVDRSISGQVASISNNQITTSIGVYFTTDYTAPKLNIGTVTSATSYSGLLVEGQRVYWDGYYNALDGGAWWGVVKTGTHTHDGVLVFTVDADTYIETSIGSLWGLSTKKAGLRGDGVTDDTVQAKRWIAVGGKLRAVKGETYIIKDEMQLIENSDVDLNGSSWKFETTENVRNFVIATGSKLHNGEIYADHDPTSQVSATTGGRAVGIYGFSDDTVNDPNNVSRWEVSKLKIYGGQVYSGGEVRGSHPILALGDVSEGTVKQIEIDGRGLTNLGFHAEWRADENFTADPSIKIKLPRNIKVSNFKFRNGDTTKDAGFVIGCSGSYSVKFSQIDIAQCYTVAIISMGEAGPSYCQADDAERINTGNVVENVKAVGVRGYAAQCFGKANPNQPGTDNVPRGDVTFKGFKVKGVPVSGSTIDGIFNSGMKRVEIKQSSEISNFSRYGVYAFNGAKETIVSNSAVHSNGSSGIYYIGNLADEQFSEGQIQGCYIHSNGKFASNDNERAGVIGFYSRNIKVLFNKFGSGLLESGIATQTSCTRGASSVYPRYWQIVGNYSELGDTGIAYIWYSARENIQVNNETYRILVSNNMITNGVIAGTHLTTTDGL